MGFGAVATEKSVSPRAFLALPSPEPAAGTWAYVRERELALSRSPECRVNYQRYQAFKRDGVKLDYLPVKLDIENVSRCNFRCTMCTVSDWHHGQRAGDLKLEAFKRLIDEQIGLVEIKLQGLGEPTMQRDDYFAMIRYAREKHIWVRTTTNASLLHLKNNYRTMIDSDVNEIQISIDGATKDVFESIRRGSMFERVKSNCKLINAYSREVGVERTKMWTVVQRGNWHQLDDLVDTAAELGFTNQVFSLDVSDWGSRQWRERNALVDVEDELNHEGLLQLVDRGKERGVRVRFWVVTQKFETGSPDKICGWPFERAFVSSDMRVVPCCIISNPDTLQIGQKISDSNSFTDIWFGKDYREFRQAHLNGQVPEACKGCYKSRE
jgi:pyrroloquinoline quinone biosynthesis protein E